MYIFLVCVSCILTVLTITKSLLFVIGLLLVNTFIYVRFKYKGLLYSLILCLIVSVLLLVYNKGGSILNKSSITGFVYKKSENYIIVQTFFGRYYIDLKGFNNSSNLSNSSLQYQIFDIVEIDIKYAALLKFNHYESGFNFHTYLNNLGVYYQVVPLKINNVFLFPLRKEYLVNYALKYFSKSNDNYTYVNSILFNANISDLSFYNKIEYSDLLLFVSTTNINIVTLNKFISKRLDKFNVKPFYIEFITLIISIFFLLLTSIKISLLRLIIIQIYYLVIHNSKRFNIGKTSKTSLLSSLELNSLIAISFLLINPYTLYQKSYYYVFSIVLFNELVKPALNLFIEYKRPVIRSFLMGIYLIPISILETNKVSILRIVLSPFLLYFCKGLFLILSLCYVFNICGIFLNPVVTLYLNILKTISITSLTIYMPNMKIVFFISFYILFYLLCLFMYFEFSHLKKYALACLIFVLFIVKIPVNIFPSYEVHFIDVGQGDATLIRSKNENILVDTGGSLYVDLATESLIPYFRKLKITSLDAVIITHSDFDHNGCLDSLTKNFQVKEVITDNSLQTIKFKSLTLENLNYDTSFSETNDSSIVLSFYLKNHSFLLMGDASKTVETYLVNQNRIHQYEYLKVGHHGSNSSSSDTFINKVRPKEAIISCGEVNKYGHPSKEVIETLNKYNVSIKNTANMGTVVIKC